MPTYEYQCDACGREFEYFQRMSEKPKSVCEACGGHLTKLLSAGSGLIFKGSGFYITDYKKGNGAKDAGSSTSSPPKSKADAGPGSSDSAQKSESATTSSSGDGSASKSD